MDSIPTHIIKIVKKQAALFFWRNYRFVVRWSDINDFEQHALLELHKRGLWNCRDTALIYITVRSACLDYHRKNSPGFRQRKGYITDCFDDTWMDSSSGGLGENCHQKLALHQLLDCLPKVHRFVVKCLIEGYKQKEIGKDLGVTEARICQIRSDIIHKLLEIETGKKRKRVIRDNKGRFKKLPEEAPIVESEIIDFKGFCKIHKGRKVINKGRGLCASCYLKLIRIGMLHCNEKEYLPYLERRLRRGEEKILYRKYQFKN
jgi:RNA polymerase sigma factor (sigma-70 family)